MSNVTPAGAAGKSPVTPPEADQYMIWLGHKPISGDLQDYTIGYMLTSPTDPDVPVAFVAWDQNATTPEEGREIWTRVKAMAHDLPETSDGTWCDLRSFGCLDSIAPMPEFVFGLLLSEVDDDGQDKGEDRWRMQPFCRFALKRLQEREQLERERAGRAAPGGDAQTGTASSTLGAELGRVHSMLHGAMMHADAALIQAIGFDMADPPAHEQILLHIEAVKREVWDYIEDPGRRDIPVEAVADTPGQAEAFPMGTFVELAKRYVRENFTRDEVDNAIQIDISLVDRQGGGETRVLVDFATAIGLPPAEDVSDPDDDDDDEQEGARHDR